MHFDIKIPFLKERCCVKNFCTIKKNDKDSLFSKKTFLGGCFRASDISRKKKQNFAGFSGANSRKNRPISRDFRGKKSQKSQKNRPISRDFSGKKSIFEGFSGANS